MKNYIFDYIVTFRKEMKMEILAESEEAALEEFESMSPLLGDYSGYLWDELEVDPCYITEDESYDDWEDEIDHEEEE